MISPQHREARRHTGFLCTRDTGGKEGQRQSSQQGGVGRSGSRGAAHFPSHLNAIHTSCVVTASLSRQRVVKVFQTRISQNVTCSIVACHMWSTLPSTSVNLVLGAELLHGQIRGGETLQAKIRLACSDGLCWQAYKKITEKNFESCTISYWWGL